MDLTIGERMKRNYERPYSTMLTRRMPVIIRLDGKGFHTFTRGCDKPFDEKISNTMLKTAEKLVGNIQGAKIAYTQSDEISLLLTDYDTIETDAWFEYNVQKICSVSASMCTAFFNSVYNHDAPQGKRKMALFDPRVFNIPKEEVMNYFLWRQQDWIRNSVQMCAQSLYSQKQLNGKNIYEMKEMSKMKGLDWDSLPLNLKYGNFITKMSHFVAPDDKVVGAFYISHEVVLDNKDMFDDYLEV